MSKKKGYITFGDINDCAIKWNLSISDVDSLSGIIATKGILICEEDPCGLDKNNEEVEFDDFAQLDYELIFDEVVAQDENLKIFIQEVREIIPAQYGEIKRLKYHVQEGNVYAKDRFFEMHLRVAIKVALQRVQVYNDEISDTIQDAAIGLLSAIEKYDPDSNVAFGSYASMWILQNIQREQATQTPLIYYPVHRKEKYYVIYPLLKSWGCNECDEIRTCLKVRDTLKEQGFEPDDIEEVIRASTSLESIDTIKDIEYSQATNLAPYSYSELSYEISHGIDQWIIENDIEDLMQALKKREQFVIVERFGLGGRKKRTLQEIGEVLEVTRERVRQIERKALQKLRKRARLKRADDFLSVGLLSNKTTTEKKTKSTVVASEAIPMPFYSIQKGSNINIKRSKGSSSKNIKETLKNINMFVSDNVNIKDRMIMSQEGTNCFDLKDCQTVVAKPADCEEMPYDHMEQLKSNLTNDFYFMNEVRYNYARIYPNANLSLVSTHNLEKMGFLVGSSYVIQNHPSEEAYFKYILSEQEEFDISAIHDRYSTLQAYIRCLNSSKSRRVIIEFEPNKYINIRKLEQMGVTLDLLEEYTNQIKNFLADDSFFSLKTLKTKGFISDLDSFNFPDHFYVSLIKEDNDLTSISFDGATIFNPKNGLFIFQDVLVEIIKQFGSIRTNNLIKILSSNYGINIDRNGLIQIMASSDIYYELFEDTFYSEQANYFY